MSSAVAERRWHALRIAVISYYLPSESKIGAGWMAHRLSNALVARTHDLTETVSETRTSMLDFSANHGCIPPCGCGVRREGLQQNAPRANFFCRCPRIAASMEKEVWQER